MMSNWLRYAKSEKGYEIMEGEQQTRAMLYYISKGRVYVNRANFISLIIFTLTNSSPNAHAPSQYLEHDGDDTTREHANSAIDKDLCQDYTS